MRINQKVVTLEEAAKQLGKTPKAVRKMLRAGTLHGEKEHGNGRWVVFQYSLSHQLTGSDDATTKRLVKAALEDHAKVIVAKSPALQQLRKPSAVRSLTPTNTDAATKALREELKAETKKLRRTYPKLWDNVPETD